MKKLYYTIEIGIEDEEYITGNKTIYVYNVVNNVPLRILVLECGNEENSKEVIKNNIDLKTFPEFELTQL